MKQKLIIIASLTLTLVILMTNVGFVMVNHICLKKGITETSLHHSHSSERTSCCAKQPCCEKGDKEIPHSTEEDIACCSVSKYLVKADITLKNTSPVVFVFNTPFPVYFLPVVR
ncbi:MAG: hypothetical protein AAF734_11515, partial [Bacteroidota bacterium]